MFSPELENLIKATLADGILEPYEKEALVKRAKNEGVDLTELEIYINSILQERKIQHDKEEDARQEQIDKEKRAAFGRVCPNCGKQVPPLTIKCDCGYEFDTVNGRNLRAAEILSQKIDEIKQKEIRLDAESDSYQKEMDKYARITCELIRNTPIPGTKEDIIDFLALSLTNSKRRGGFLGNIKGRLKVLGIISIFTWLLLAFMLTAGKGYDFGAYLVVGFVIGAIIFIIGSILSFTKGRTMLRENKIADAWRAKFTQVLIKGRSLRGDETFTQQLNYYESQINTK